MTYKNKEHEDVTPFVAVTLLFLTQFNKRPYMEGMKTIIHTYIYTYIPDSRGTRQ